MHVDDHIMHPVGVSKQNIRAKFHSSIGIKGKWIKYEYSPWIYVMQEHTARMFRSLTRRHIATWGKLAGKSVWSNAWQLAPESSFWLLGHMTAQLWYQSFSICFKKITDKFKLRPLHAMNLGALRNLYLEFDCKLVKLTHCYKLQWADTCTSQRFNAQF